MFAVSLARDLFAVSLARDLFAVSLARDLFAVSLARDLFAVSLARDLLSFSNALQDIDAPESGRILTERAGTILPCRCVSALCYLRVLPWQLTNLGFRSA